VDYSKTIKTGCRQTLYMNNKGVRPNNRPKITNNKGMRANYRPMRAFFEHMRENNG